MSLFKYSYIAFLFYLIILPRTGWPQVSSYVILAQRLSPPPVFNQDFLLAEPNTKLSERIDKSILKILFTPSGKNLCYALPSDTETFRKSLFINIKYADKGYDICRPFLNKHIKFKIFEKKYLLKFTDETRFPADGWTSPRNETFLFFNRREFEKNDERLIKSLAHELAVSYDSKELIGFSGTVNVADLDLAESTDLDIIIPIIRSADFRNSLSSLRAFELEYRISTELGFDHYDFIKGLAKMSCTEKVLAIKPYSQELHRIFASENFANLFDIDFSNRKAWLTYQLSFEDKLKLLAKLEFHFTNGTTVNACEYLTSGWPFQPGISFHGGPGPRIGGW